MKSISRLFILITGFSMAGCADATKPLPTSPPFNVASGKPAGDIGPYISPHRVAAQKLGVRPISFNTSLIDGHGCGGVGMSPCPNVPDNWVAVFTASRDGLHSLGSRSAKFNSANEFSQDTLIRLRWMINQPRPPAPPQPSKAEMEKYTQLWTQRLAGQIDFSKESAFIFHRGGGASLKTRLQLINNQLSLCVVPVKIDGPEPSIFSSEFAVFAGPKKLEISEQIQCP